jgi:hypothetical protein
MIGVPEYCPCGGKRQGISEGIGYFECGNQCVQKNHQEWYWKATCTASNETKLQATQQPAPADLGRA